MKANKWLLLISVISLTGGLFGCDKGENKKPNPPDPHYTDPSELGKLESLFTSLSTGYNFTLNSYNEGGTNRVLKVFSEYAYYYSYSSYSHRGDYGRFYVEGQGAQDFHLEDDQVVIDFHEGPGKINMVDYFAHDDYGDEFAHLPMSDLLGIDWTHFYKVDENNYYTTDKNINRIFNYFSNEYYANWKDDYGGEEWYVNFTKSKTTIEFDDDRVNITFLPSYTRRVPAGATTDGSLLSIYNIGTTSNEAISSYLANPQVFEKKESYGFNAVDYAATFGDVTIPFSSKFSPYISPVESYKNAAITVYDMSYESGLLADIQANLPTNWAYDEKESQYLTKQMGHTVYSYHASSTITSIVEEQEIQDEVDVYYSIAEVPASGTAIDRTLRPNGFFVGEIYRKLSSEAITDYEAIVNYLDENSNLDYLPRIERLQPYSIVLRDYTEEPTLQDAFAAQGLYLYKYLVLKVEGLSSSGAINLSRNFKDDIKNKECYSEVTLSSDYELNATPDIDYFTKKGEPYVQLMGSTIKDSGNTIIGYQLIIMVYAPY